MTELQRPDAYYEAFPDFGENFTYIQVHSHSDYCRKRALETAADALAEAEEHITLVPIFMKWVYKDLPGITDEERKLLDGSPDGLELDAWFECERTDRRALPFYKAE